MVTFNKSNSHLTYLLGVGSSCAAPKKDDLGQSLVEAAGKVEGVGTQTAMVLAAISAAKTDIGAQVAEVLQVAREIPDNIDQSCVLQAILLLIILVILMFILVHVFIHSFIYYYYYYYYYYILRLFLSLLFCRRSARAPRQWSRWTMITIQITHTHTKTVTMITYIIMAIMMIIMIIMLI